MMTVEEFLKKLEATGEVDVPGGGRVRAPLGVRGAIGETLRKILSDADVVSAGVELSTLQFFDNQWQGQTEFLLACARHVLRIVATVQEGQTATLKVVHDLFPRTQIRHVTVTTAHQGSGGQAYLRSVEVVVHLAGGAELKATATLPATNPEPLLHLARDLQAS